MVTIKFIKKEDFDPVLYGSNEYKENFHFAPFNEKGLLKLMVCCASGFSELPGLIPVFESLRNNDSFAAVLQKSDGSEYLLINYGD